jgi:hypothetical protein
MAGYREGRGNPESDEEQAPSKLRRDFIIVSLVVLALLFLLDVLSWFTERGGVFSVLSALVSLPARPPVIDVDKDGLWLIFAVVSWLSVTVFCRMFQMQIDISTRAKALLPTLLIIAGAFVLNGVLGEGLVTSYMAGQGYSRCVNGDWAQGNGKSRVWFADYVLQGVECRQRMQTVPERSLFR